VYLCDNSHHGQGERRAAGTLQVYGRMVGFDDMR
jgi:hypothetical protein